MGPGASTGVLSGPGISRKLNLSPDFDMGCCEVSPSEVGFTERSYCSSEGLHLEMYAAAPWSPLSTSCLELAVEGSYSEP